MTKQQKNATTANIETVLRTVATLRDALRRGGTLQQLQDNLAKLAIERVTLDKLLNKDSLLVKADETLLVLDEYFEHRYQMDVDHPDGLTLEEIEELVTKLSEQL